ncbi:hypothetical protein, partial [Brevibacillus agri]|uniref:hypothetical protein n=1 Tax=Brevibacillus agri TaxID=51101 RepID=UPI002867CA4A
LYQGRSSFSISAFSNSYTHGDFTLTLVLPSVKQVSPAKRHAHGGMPSSDDLLFGLSLDSCLGSLFLFGFWPFSTLPKRFSRTFFNQLANYSQNPFILP